MDKHSIKGKRKARKLALQAIYQWLMSESDLYEIETQFRISNNMEQVDIDYFRKLLYGMPENVTELENAFQEYIDRKPAELNPVERAAIYLGAFELMNCPEIPYKVILDEAVTLTKQFGSQDGHRYVNGVLNKLARKVRADEIE